VGEAPRDSQDTLDDLVAKAMRLCFISNPNSTHTQRWVGWFARHGHTVCLLADAPLQTAWPDIQVVDLTRISNASLIRFPIWAVWLRRFLHQWKPDILHAHRVNSAGWVAAASGFHPLVVTPWGTDLNKLPKSSPVERWLARFVLKNADLVTADARDLLDKASQYGAKPVTLHEIQWGVDLQHFRPDPADPNLRAELKLGTAPVILSPRGVNPIYNLDTIIRALPGVRSVVPEATLLLRDYNTDPVYKGFLEDLIASLDLAGVVRWIGRIEPWERLADYYRLADVVVSVPNSDGTPVSVLEALACGIPVIVTDLPALREWLIADESALFVPVGDSNALSAAICRLLTQKELSERLANSGLAIVIEHANHETEMKKMEELYQTLLDQRT
jgi:glycosyltransferase involved in cell wall biosynthesis